MITFNIKAIKNASNNLRKCSFLWLGFFSVSNAITEMIERESSFKAVTGNNTKTQVKMPDRENKIIIFTETIANKKPW